MSRPVLVVLLLCAAAFTAMLAFTLSSDGGGTRGGRASAGAEQAEVRRDAPAEGPGRKPDTRPEKTRVYPVSGRVQDPRGRAIAGAVVRGGGVEARTDAGGGYRLALPSPAVAFDVYAHGYLPIAGSVNGRPAWDRMFVCEGPGPWRKDFVLQPAARLTGRLFDPDRRPVAGARVYVISPDRALLEESSLRNTTLSDEQGYFRFPGLPKGLYDLGVRADGFLPALRHDVEVGEEGLVERVLSLRRGRKLVVAVRNSTDETGVIASDSRLRQKLLPPGGLEVLADALVGREYADLPVVLTGRREQGRFTLTGVARGPADVAAKDPRRITEPGLGSLLDTTEAELELTLVTSTEIEIRVFDETTREALEPAVFRRSSDGGEPVPVPVTGGAAAVPADRRRHTLHFRLQGYEEAKLELPAQSETWPEFFEVLMRPLADGETGRFTLVFDQLLGARVAVVGRNADGRRIWTRHLAETSPKEKWAVTKVPFGEYRVSVLATGMIPVVLPRVVVARGLDEQHRVTLSPGGGLEMKVTDQGGKLLDRVGILLKDAAGNQIDIHVMTKLSDRRAFVSVNVLPVAATARADSGLAPGAYTLTAYRQGYDPVTEEFVIQGSEVAKVTIALPSR